jgi:L-lactate utilization protein LutC
VTSPKKCFPLKRELLDKSERQPQAAGQHNRLQEKTVEQVIKREMLQLIKRIFDDTLPKVYRVILKEMEKMASCLDGETVVGLGIEEVMQGVDVELEALKLEEFNFEDFSFKATGTAPQADSS